LYSIFRKENKPFWSSRFRDFGIVANKLEASFSSFFLHFLGHPNFFYVRYNFILFRNNLQLRAKIQKF